MVEKCAANKMHEDKHSRTYMDRTGIPDVIIRSIHAKRSKIYEQLLMFIFSKLKEMRFAHYSAIIDSITCPHFIRSTTQRITKQEIAYLLLKKIQKRCE